ncbi:398_t:CDS:2 [Cetraspora pellucida]|uniref:398_t:CDS:1 n=1 Tax=Cetraspora pellucida TaxID=1433469 RepID=A0A9N8Z0X7_9GLOM|nr:398_t:CDS:2 [Cetraspora pellucida]
MPRSWRQQLISVGNGLSTEGNKADLIERLTHASNLLHSHSDLLNGNIESGGSEVFENTHGEEGANQESNLRCESSFFSMSPKPLSDDESHDKRYKKIKHLHEDVNNFTEWVKVSNMQSEIYKNWPEVKFERSRDQFEYNVLCAIGNDLYLELSILIENEVIQHIENVRTKMFNRVVILNVTKEYS